MISTFRRFALFAAAIAMSGSCFGQVITQPYATVEEYVTNVLLGEGVTVSNITYTGGISQLGLLEEGLGTFSVDDGLMLNTDNALCFDACVDCLGAGNDPDLLNVANSVPPLIGQSFNVSSVNDLCVVEFDFEAGGDSISFNYVFGSDEYLTYVNTQYNDIFAFFLSGPGLSGPYSAPAGFPDGAINIAEIPDTDGWPITISSVNNVTNPQFYVDNPGQTGICTNGYTTTFTAKAAVQCGETYHIKLAIADGSDTALESFVVLEAGSFSSGSIDLVADAVSVDGADNLDEFYQSMVDGIGNTLSYEGYNDFPLADWVEWKLDPNSTSNFSWEINPDEFIDVDALVMEGCNDVQFQIIRPSATATEIDTLYLDVAGTAQEGLDFNSLFTQVIMNVDETEVLATLGTKYGEEDQGDEGPEYVTVSFDYVNGCDELVVLSATVLIVDPVPIQATLGPLPCHDASTGEIELAYTDISGFGPFDFDWFWQGESLFQENDVFVAPSETFSLLDPTGNIYPIAQSILTVSDACINTDTVQFLTTFVQSVAQDAEMCTSDEISLSVSNLVNAGVQDVLIDGQSVVGLDPFLASTPPVAVLSETNDNGWIVGNMISSDDLGSSVEWDGELTIVDSCGFKSTAKVVVEQCITPNVFTPNGDDANNQFEIRGLLGQLGARLSVYNRYGNLIYEDEIDSPDQNKLMWAGRYLSGDDAPEGVYQWVLVRPDGEKEVGNISLFR